MVGDVEIPTRRVGAAAESEPGEQPRRLHSPAVEAAEAKSAARRSPGVHSLCLERHGSAPSYGSWSETCLPSLRPNAVQRAGPGPGRPGPRLQGGVDLRRESRHLESGSRAPRGTRGACPPGARSDCRRNPMQSGPLRATCGVQGEEGKRLHPASENSLRFL